MNANAASWYVAAIAAIRSAEPGGGPQRRRRATPTRAPVRFRTPEQPKTAPAFRASIPGGFRSRGPFSRGASPAPGSAATAAIAFPILNVQSLIASNRVTAPGQQANRRRLDPFVPNVWAPGIRIPRGQSGGSGGGGQPPPGGGGGIPGGGFNFGNTGGGSYDTGGGVVSY